MTPRFPLFAKILGWLLLNLLILAAVALVLFKAQFHFGLDSLLAGSAGERMQALGTALAGELRERPITAWNDVLTNFSQAYKVEFLLFRPDGTQIAGAPTALPPELQEKMAEQRGPGPGMRRGPPPGRGPRVSWEEAGPGPLPRFLVRTEKPTQYWAGLRLPLSEPGSVRPWPVVLFLRSDSLGAGGLLIDFKPWVLAGFGALLFSVLFWLPMVKGVTRALSQMTRVTEQIAQGNFEVKAEQQRRDELGRLGQAINTMAARLSGFVTGQKRFLGDVAHELCSPLARMQVGLGILEQHADEKQKSYLQDVRDEVQQMSALVNELLSFSKAGLAAKNLRLEPVNVRGVAQAAVDREAGDGAEVRLEITEDLYARAEPDLLMRALANLLRNAVRYAAGAGPIQVRGARRNSQVEILVQDNGPGVPPEALDRIFDPFFRAESSRSRDTGGVGLGLTIVKTCIEACRGAVAARNRSPQGLEVQITLEAAASPTAAEVNEGASLDGGMSLDSKNQPSADNARSALGREEPK